MLIEMHAHVIYGVDDGPKTLEEMQQMLYAAQKSGVDHLFCTSHVAPGEREFPIETYRRHFAEAELWCAEHAPQMHLHMGAEILSTQLAPMMLSNGSVLPLGDSEFILLEFEPTDTFSEIENAVSDLREAGWKVILAHAERYRALYPLKRMQRLRQKHGVRIQINAGTVFDEQYGFFFKRRVRKWIEKGIVDFVSSDAHNFLDRPFCLEYAWHWLEQNFDLKTAKLLCGDRFAKAFGLTQARSIEK